MVEEITQQGAEPTRSGIRSGPTPMAMCPMATMCGRMMEKPPSGLLLMLPGSVLVATGVLTFIEPRILIWLVGTVTVLMGIMLLVMATFIHRLGRRLTNAKP